MEYLTNLYCITKAESKYIIGDGFDPKDRSMYLNKIAVPIEFKENDYGVFLVYEKEDPFCSWHRIVTSLIEEVEVTDNEIVVTTDNTVYNFTKIDDVDRGKLC